MKKFLVLNVAILLPVTCLAEKSESLGALLDEVAHIHKSVEKSKRMTEEQRNRLFDIEPKLTECTWDEYQAEISNADKMGIEDILSLGSLCARSPHAWKVFEKFYSSKSDAESVVALITYQECEKIQSKKFSESITVKAERLAKSNNLDIAMVGALNWYVALQNHGQSVSPAIEWAGKIVSDINKQASKSEVQEMWSMILEGVIDAHNTENLDKKKEILMPAYAIMSQRFGINLWQNSGY